MKTPIWAAILACAVLQPASSAASPYEEDEEEQGHFPAPVYRYFDTREAAEAAMNRDIKFADEMGHHHQGAVDMSRAYLDDPRGTNPFLQKMAGAIIYNQEFEIAWLEDLKRRVSAGPDPLLQIGDMGLIRLPAGLTGMEHKARFQKAPVLSVMEPVSAQVPSDYDVMFAKAMKMHHQMGVEMAHEYNNDPAGGNKVIREINIGIIRDQMMEIGILSDFIAQYPGNPDAIQIEPEMHEMMKMHESGMPHHN
ncbi:DUF305 domain-containing protein [Dongia deserti]|uniref:DUF305 domain-containing protein n=1 Tax=Dongia deserti TaxID=2268030 RepID=UPI000E6485C2|nr:DUF305 domain-containing protein [Dongia deserti]